MSLFLRRFSLACLLTLVSGAGLLAQDYWQQEVNSIIDVSLNDTEHTLDGFIKIQYINHSPDTLRFIWFHLWPNAYKNDQTAFSEQLLGNGRTDFYFSPKERKGYINRLDFRVDGLLATMQDHPRYIDVIKIILPQPLPPGAQTTITTPFHEQLPFNFSRGGHVGGAYQVTQWYPKPAVYDRKGWHEMPYLDQGEFYSEYGRFDVRITLPAKYVVAATGTLQQDSASPITKSPNPQISKSPRTLHYTQDKIHDFAWFADPRFRVDHDTLQLPSGRVIDVFAYYRSTSAPVWQHSIRMIKQAVRFRSSLIGEYPFSAISVAEAKIGTGGGMEYPMIAAIAPQTSSSELEKVIGHEVGHNWFYAVLGSDERRYPWMDEGIDTYYDDRYAKTYPPPAGRVLPSPAGLALVYNDALARIKKDQPISTSSEDLTAFNYGMIAYHKAAIWMRLLEDSLGRPLFDSVMHTYFRRWQFRHPGPEDFRAVISSVAGPSMGPQRLDALFSSLDEKGPLPPLPTHRPLRAMLFSPMPPRDTHLYNYLYFAPGVGYNKYDGVLLGALVYNYGIPAEPFQYFLAPLYGTNSHQLDGLGRISYSWYPDDRFRKISLGLSGSRFSTLSGIDSNGKKLSGGFYKIAPFLRLTLQNKTPRSTIERWVEWKSFLIGEKGFDNYVQKSTDSQYYPTAGNYHFRYLNQLSYFMEDTRVLYPYNFLLQAQQASRWYRLNFTGNYFFNYAQGGGLNLRLFAARFGYIGGRGNALDLSAYQPKLTAVRGDEDYTYSNYFIGRNEFTGSLSQQIMVRDGGLKLRTDLFQGIQGRSDDWVAALNFTSSLPHGFLPPQIPLKIFLDIGSYSDAWHANAPTSKFLYTAGLQLSLFHDLLNVYAPLFYSSDFRNSLKTVPEENTFLKKLSFSIDLQNLLRLPPFDKFPL